MNVNMNFEQTGGVVETNNGQVIIDRLGSVLRKEHMSPYDLIAAIKSMEEDGIPISEIKADDAAMILIKGTMKELRSTELTIGLYRLGLISENEKNQYTSKESRVMTQVTRDKLNKDVLPQWLLKFLGINQN